MLENFLRKHNLSGMLRQTTFCSQVAKNHLYDYAKAPPRLFDVSLEQVIKILAPDQHEVSDSMET